MAVVNFVITTDSAGGIVGIQRYNAALHSMGTAADNESKKATTAFDRMTTVINKMQSAIIGMIAAFVFTRAIRAVQELISVGIEFEHSFGGIRKTVDGTVEDFARLSDEMRQLAKVIPINVNELNKIGEIAGQLGVPTNEIAKFTETIAKIGSATNLSVEEAATNMARFMAIMQEPTERVKVLGSVLVELGNKFAANEQEILAFSMNIAGAGQLVGLSSDQVMALGASLASVGLHAEKAGSAMSRILIEMQQAISDGGKKLEVFAETAGKTTAQFTQDFGKDAATALLAFLTGLEKMDKSGGDVIGTLEALSLQEIRVRDVTLRASQAAVLFGEAMKVAGKESQTAGDALDKEFNKRVEESKAQLQLVQNRLEDHAITLSLKLLPALVATAQGFANLVDAISGLSTGNGLGAATTGVLLLGQAFVSLRLEQMAREINLLGNFMGALGIGGMKVDTSVMDARVRAEAASMDEALAFTKAFAVQKEQIDNDNIASTKKVAEEFTKAVDKMKKSVMDAAQDAPVLNEALRQMLAAGVPVSMIFEKMGNNIDKTASDLRKLGLEVPSVIAALDAMNNVVMKAPLPEYGDQINQALAAMQALRNTAPAAYLSRNDYVNGGDLFNPLVDMDPLRSTADMIPEVLASFQRFQSQGLLDSNIAFAMSQATKDQAKKDANEMATNISKAFDKVFEQLVKKGKLSWKDIGNFAAEVFEDVAKSLFSPLTKVLTDWIAGPLKGLADKLGEGLTESLKGSFLGDKFGKAIGGLASAGIGAAMGMALNALSGLLAKSGSEVNNNLVNDLQNPFTDAVGNLVRSFNEAREAGKMTLETAVEARASLTSLYTKFKSDTADYAALGAKQSAAVRGAFETIEKYWGKDLAILFNDFDSVITELGGTAGMTSADLEELNKAMATLDEFAQAVESIVKSVTAQADGVEVMAAALDRLVELGVPTELILSQLGTGIGDMAEQLRILGREVPDIILQFERLARLEEVKNELEDVTKALGEALVSKLEYLDRTIEKSNQQIGKWTTEIEKLNDDITDAKDKLSDVEYWQKRYTDSIRDAENALKSASEKRKSIEEEILKLTTQVEKDRLEQIIKSSHDQYAILQAQADLTALQNAEELAEQQGRISRLAELKLALPEAIRLEAESLQLLKDRKAVTEATITAERLQLSEYISTKEQERSALSNSINMERARIAALQAEQETVRVAMSIIGAVRLTEIERINATIVSLTARGIALGEEKLALERLLGIAGQLNDAFNRINAGGTGTTNDPAPTASTPGSGSTAANNDRIAVQTPYGTRYFTAAEYAAEQAARANLGIDPLAGTNTNISRYHNFLFQLASGNTASALNLPTAYTRDEYLARLPAGSSIINAYASGTGARGVPMTGAYMLHQGETVMPAGQSGGGVAIHVGSVVVQNGSRDEADKFLKHVADGIKNNRYGISDAIRKVKR